MHFWLWIGLVVSLLSLTSCQPDPLGKALRGDLSPEESNTVIRKYCEGCHIHRALMPTEHMEQVRSLYHRLPYTEATQCRVCHLVAEDTWGTKRRKTLFPADVAQNRRTVLELFRLKGKPKSADGKATAPAKP